jgi:hypothetical protein
VPRNLEDLGGECKPAEAVVAPGLVRAAVLLRDRHGGPSVARPADHDAVDPPARRDAQPGGIGPLTRGRLERTGWKVGGRAIRARAEQTA